MVPLKGWGSLGEGRAMNPGEAGYPFTRVELPPCYKTGLVGVALPLGFTQVATQPSSSPRLAALGRACMQQSLAPGTALSCTDAPGKRCRESAGSWIWDG